MQIVHSFEESSFRKNPFEIYLGYLPRSHLDFSFGAKSEENWKYDAEKERKFIQGIQQINKVVQE